MNGSTVVGVVVVILISIIGYYAFRSPGGCTGNVVGPGANVSGAHVKPNSAYLACNIQTGQLDTQCTATCVPPVSVGQGDAELYCPLRDLHQQRSMWRPAGWDMRRRRLRLQPRVRRAPVPEPGPVHEQAGLRAGRDV